MMKETSLLVGLDGSVGAKLGARVGAREPTRMFQTLH